MQHTRRIGFRILNADGHPVETRIEEALVALVPRFLRHFPRFRDDPALTEALEEVARRISQREQTSGPIAALHGYAWVALRSVAVSILRRGPATLRRRTIDPEEAEEVLRSIPSRLGTPAEIERGVLFRQILAMLTLEERLVCAWKRAGFSSQEIARRRGTTAAAVDKLLSRARERVRANLAQRAGYDLQAASFSRETAEHAQRAYRSRRSRITSHMPPHRSAERLRLGRGLSARARAGHRRLR
jgi:DNA-directed RNA polymerase specialized sigma24 family protein